jgi:hypothetical protein
MRGHAYKRGSSWTVVYDEQADDDGKRRQRSKGGFATKREAEQWLTDTLAKMATGSYAAPSKLTLGDFLQHEWLPAVTGTVRPLTASTTNPQSASLSSRGSVRRASRRSLAAR